MNSVLSVRNISSPVSNRATSVLADIISPWRFDGVTIVLMLNASGSVTINLETLEVPRYSIMVIDETMPVNLHCDDVSDMEAYLLFLSKAFLESVNIDTNAIGHHPFHPENSPVLKLSEDNTALIQKYLGLLRDNAEMPMKATTASA